jgi:hypothetical protein
LYARLQPGGRLYLGNLQEAPDTTWMMEYVLAWHLTYRTPDSMQALARGLTPPPAEISVDIDASGYALFLSVRAPG